MQVCNDKTKINIKEAFENCIFETIKETEKILDRACNENDLYYVKREILYLRNRYQFIKDIEIEHKEFHKIYQIMNQKLKQENRNGLKLVPDSK